MGFHDNLMAFVKRYEHTCRQWRRQDFVSGGGHRFGVVKRAKIISVCRTTPGSTVYSWVCVITLGLCVIHIYTIIKWSLKFKKLPIPGINKKLSWCCQTRATRLEASQGHRTWYTIHVSYGFLLVCYSKSVRRAVSEIFDCKNAVTLKTELGVRHGHWKCHHSMEHVWIPIDVL